MTLSIGASFAELCFATGHNAAVAGSVPGSLPDQKKPGTPSMETGLVSVFVICTGMPVGSASAF